MSRGTREDNCSKDKNTSDETEELQHDEWLYKRLLGIVCKFSWSQFGASSILKQEPKVPKLLTKQDIQDRRHNQQSASEVKEFLKPAGKRKEGAKQ
jgi:hypothetical protein